MPKKTKEIENKIENIRNLLSKKNETKSKDDKSTKKATTSKSNKKDTEKKGTSKSSTQKKNVSKNVLKRKHIKKQFLLSQAKNLILLQKQKAKYLKLFLQNLQAKKSKPLHFHQNIMIYHIDIIKQ